MDFSTNDLGVRADRNVDFNAEGSQLFGYLAVAFSGGVVGILCGVVGSWLMWS